MDLHLSCRMKRHASESRQLNDELKTLIELQQFDSRILALKIRIDTAPSQFSADEASFKEANAALEKAKQNQLSVEKKKKEKETEIEDIKEKIKKLKTRSADIKNNKEYQAHLKEIEKNEKDIKAAEDLILSLMEKLDESQKAVLSENTRINAEKLKLDAAKAELEKEIEQYRVELEGLKKERPGIVSKISKDTYNFYMSILRDKRGLAVVKASNEICCGCNLHIPPQMFVELKTSDEILQCQECRRILYYEHPSPEPAGGAKQQ
ncbi:MAG: hypothetical protein EPN22_03425 [Nitrospirae bacterium]|nr:MAG: hypothetical protein EPN22_03425 [Nitrospirota bacterium]